MVRLGQRLHKERLRQKLTLDEIASAIKIKPAFLSAIERGEYHKLPSSSYAQGFVQNYSSYLGIPKAEITALFKREFDEKKTFKVLPDSLVARKEIPIHRLKIQQSLLIAGVLFCIFVVYLMFQYRAAFLPPSLIIASPKENSVNSQEVTVSGYADPNATVSVNGVSVPVTHDGSYSRRLMLFPGKAAITIKAVNRFGKESVVTRNIVVQ